MSENEKTWCLPKASSRSTASPFPGVCCAGALQPPASSTPFPPFHPALGVTSPVVLLPTLLLSAATCLLWLGQHQVDF